MNKEGIQSFELTGTWPDLGKVPLSVAANHPEIASAWAASIAKVRIEALEEAAKHLEVLAPRYGQAYFEDAAIAIRSLKK